MLRRIGIAHHYTNLKNLVVKLSTVPPLYIPVYTYSMKRVGTIYDVIGRVDSPYGLVRPASIDQSLLGQGIYVKESDVAKRGRRK